jgi:hypothetical protein
MEKIFLEYADEIKQAEFVTEASAAVFNSPGMHLKF